MGSVKRAGGLLCEAIGAQLSCNAEGGLSNAAHDQERVVISRTTYTC